MPLDTLSSTQCSKTLKNITKQPKRTAQYRFNAANA